ncbi:30S ribosomal protein S1 [Acidobacteriota bacterium]
MSELPKSTKEDKLSSKEYEDLLDKYQFSSAELTPGTLVKGKVIKVTSAYVLVDVGFKSEGLIPTEDFDDPKDMNSFSPGDEIEAMLERSNAKEGYLILSRKKAIAVKALNNLEKAYQNNHWIIGKVTERIKNGYIVNVGIDTFLPESHADIKIINDPEKLIGNRYKFKVIKFDRRSENAVVSRKLLLQDEKEKRKTQVFSQLSKGQKVKGQVKSLTNFGAFVDIGGIEGLLHVSDISWGKLNHPSSFLHTGQDIEVLILDFNEKEEKISLGLKQLAPDPWEDIESRYFIQQKVQGKVVSLTDFGAFVELEKGIEGLIHISDLSWSRKMVHPKKILKTGEEVTVSILGIQAEAKRISLGLKQVNPHPLEIFQQTYSPGSRVKGMITNITDFGAFLEVEKGIEGLIHISDISWEKIKHPSDKLKVGDEIDAIVLNIDVNKQKLSLGIKQLEGDIWEDFFNRRRVGDLVKVKIVRIVDFGVFAEISPGIEGVVFLSELDDKKIENPSDLFSVGDEKSAKILKLSQQDKKISLSFKQAQLEMQKRDYQKYMDGQDKRHTLGDIMKDQFDKITTNKKEEIKEKEEVQKASKKESKKEVKETGKETIKKASKKVIKKEDKDKGKEVSVAESKKETKKESKKEVKVPSKEKGKKVIKKESKKEGKK